MITFLLVNSLLIVAGFLLLKIIENKKLKKRIVIFKKGAISAKATYARQYQTIKRREGRIKRLIKQIKIGSIGKPVK